MTKIDGINRMLRYIGELPVPNDIVLEELPEGHEALMSREILNETIREEQQRKFWFNSFKQKFVPNTLGYITLPFNIVSFKGTGTTKYVRSGNDLYDATNETKIFTEAVDLDVVLEIDFDDLPAVFQTYVVLQAAKKLHMYMNGDEGTQKVLATDIQLQYVLLDRENMKQSKVNFLTGTRLADRTTNPSPTI